MDIIKVLAVGIGAALISTFVTWLIASKRTVIENITHERAKWREKIRERAMLVHDAMIKRSEEDLDRLRNEFRALLNPCDCEDVSIIRCIELPKPGGELMHAEEFAERIARLLKHDWERAKREAKPFSFLRPKRKRNPDCACGSEGGTKTGEIAK